MNDFESVLIAAAVLGSVILVISLLITGGGLALGAQAAHHWLDRIMAVVYGFLQVLLGFVNHWAAVWLSSVEDRRNRPPDRQPSIRDPTPSIRQRDHPTRIHPAPPRSASAPRASVAPRAFPSIPAAPPTVDFPARVGPPTQVSAPMRDVATRLPEDPRDYATRFATPPETPPRIAPPPMAFGDTTGGHRLGAPVDSTMELLRDDDGDLDVFAMEADPNDDRPDSEEVTVVMPGGREATADDIDEVPPGQQIRQTHSVPPKV